MKYPSLISLFSVLLMLNGCSSTQPLLDESLTNFNNVYEDGEAIFVDGELQLISEKNWFFSTKKVYDDFVRRTDISYSIVNLPYNSKIRHWRILLLML